MTSSSPPTVWEGKLFSNVTRLGFAAAHDSPALKIEEAHPSRSTEMTSQAPFVGGNLHYFLLLQFKCMHMIYLYFVAEECMVVGTNYFS